eukprot:Selendium_serpulae@DN5882_c0_g2_i1.p1
MAHSQFARSFLWLGGIEKRENPTSSCVPSGFFFPNDRSFPVDLRHEAPKLCWIGHSTFYVTVSGVGILTDPIWSSRVVPHLSHSIAMNWVGPKRRFPPPFEVEDVERLPFVQVVVISHNHYDHLDERTVDRLHDRFPWIYWIVPLKARSWFLDKGFEKDRVVELDWWEHVELDIEPHNSAESKTCTLALPTLTTRRKRRTGGDALRDDTAKSQGSSHKVTVHFVPSRHGSGRHFFDQNRSGWGGFVISVPHSSAVASNGRSQSRDLADPSDFGSVVTPPRPSNTHEVSARTRHMGDHSLK